MGIRRIAILDHANHNLYVEDVTEKELEKYDGSEQAYIDDNYTFDGDYSWEYITDALYMPAGYDGDFIDIPFDSL